MRKPIIITKPQVKWLLITLGILVVVIALLICLGLYTMIDDDRGLG